MSIAIELLKIGFFPHIKIERGNTTEDFIYIVLLREVKCDIICINYTKDKYFAFLKKC